MSDEKDVVKLVPRVKIDRDLPAFPMYSQNNYSVSIAGGLTKFEYVAAMFTASCLSTGVVADAPALGIACAERFFDKLES